MPIMAATTPIPASTWVSIMLPLVITPMQAIHAASDAHNAGLPINAPIYFGWCDSSHLQVLVGDEAVMLSCGCVLSLLGKASVQEVEVSKSKAAINTPINHLPADKRGPKSPLI